jgi:hypothetical protein
MPPDQSQGQNAGSQGNPPRGQAVDPKLDANVREIQKGDDPKNTADIRHVQESRERYLRKEQPGDNHAK